MTITDLASEAQRRFNAGHTWESIVQFVKCEAVKEVCRELMNDLQQNTPPRREALDQRDDPTEKDAASRRILEDVRA